MSVVQRLWAFVLTLVHSLTALFSLRRRRAAEPFALPSVAPADVARAHTRLRPILLTPRSIARAQRTQSATSTLVHHEPAPQRTSPKLTPADAELGLPAADSEAGPAGSASRQGTPDTDTASLSTPPLTPPDRCYLAPLPSLTDCPYAEGWSHAPLPLEPKPRLVGSPLKLSDAFPSPMLGPIGSPPPAHWSPSQVWTSTPCKTDEDAAPAADPPSSTADPSSALANISHALVSRSRGSIKPYDDASPPVSHAPPFHRPEAYAAWRHPARLPGKPGRPPRSQSHPARVPAQEWYGADAYVPSPVSALSPPRSDSGTESDADDDDEVPLGRLRERLARRSAVHRTIAVPGPACMSPHMRRMSEGCLLALCETTPTRIGVGVRSRRKVASVSLAAGDGDPGYKDWLEVLSLRFPPEHKDGPRLSGVAV